MRTLWITFTGHVLLWLIPMVLFFGGLAWLAWKTSSAPASPFTYEVY